MRFARSSAIPPSSKYARTAREALSFDGRSIRTGSSDRKDHLARPPPGRYDARHWLVLRDERYVETAADLVQNLRPPRMDLDLEEDTCENAPLA